MDAHQVLATLKKKEYHPIYLLHGEEAYYIDQVTDYLADHVLEESQKGFDQTVLYGKDTDLVTVVNAARRFPMMAPYQVIIVKEAQDLKWKTEEGVLLKYLENPMPSTILVLAHKHGKIDKRKKFYKLAQKIGTVLESDKIYDNKVPAWVSAYVQNHQRKIHPQAAALIGEYLGTEISKIVNELEKLMLNVPADREINLSDIERFIGISKDFNMFELNTALGKRDVVKAFRIVDYFAANPRNNPLFLIVATVSGYFTKILKYHYLPDKSPQVVAKELGVHPFFTAEYQIAARNYNRRKTFDVIHILQEYDMKSKGVGVGDTPQGELLKEMVYKILHGGGTYA